MTDIAPLQKFVRRATELVERHGADEAALFADLEPLLKDLIRTDGWLPDAYRQHHPGRERATDEARELAAVA